MLDKTIKSVLVAAALFAGANIASAASFIVDPLCTDIEPDSICDDANTFMSIQDAIDAASGGDDITVVAGTYNENITIDVSVIINGANSGTAGYESRDAESVIDGGGATAVTIAADDVLFDGFTVQGGGGVSDGSGIIIGASNSGVTIQNTIITGNQIGLYANCASDCWVAHNLFIDNNEPGAAGGAGIYTDMGSNGMTIDSNEFTGHLNNSAVIFAATSPTTNSDLTFTNNNIYDNNGDNSMVYVLSVDGAVFSGNTISGGANGLNFASANNNIEVYGNVLTGNGRGVKIVDDGYGFGDNSNIVIFDNDLSGNSIAGIEVVSGYVGTLDVSPNFWGPGGPTHASNSSGTGSAAIGDLSFTPWYVDDEMVDLQGLTTTNGNGTQSLTLVAETYSEVESDEGEISVEIPAGTTFTGPANWDGSILMPTLDEDFTFFGNENEGKSPIVAIQVGNPGTTLTLSNAARLVFEGQAGQLVGWTTDSVLSPITTVCSADDQATVDAQLGEGSDCKIDDGGDLVVWTKHFTVFMTYTETAVDESGGGSGGGTVIRSTTTTGGEVAGASTEVPATATQGEVLGASTGGVYFYPNNLSQGMRGADVSALQQRLIDEGFLKIAAPTGYFGPLTLAAVKAFQAHYGVPATGFVGPLTRAVLNS